MTCPKAEQKEESRAAKAPGFFLCRSLGQHHLIGIEVIERDADQRDLAVPEGQYQIVVLLRGVVANIPAGAFGTDKHQFIGGVEAIQLVAAKIPAEQEGIAVADALQDVIAAAADEGQVAAGVADQRVVAGVAEQPGVVAASLQEIIAVAAACASTSSIPS